ncbi:MAG: hypothetical protein EZS28_002537, partial [Streblomastix strix]
PESDLTRAVSQVGLNKMVEGGNGYEQIFHDEKDEEENFDDDEDKQIEGFVKAKQKSKSKTDYKQQQANPPGATGVTQLLQSMGLALQQSQQQTPLQQQQIQALQQQLAGSAEFIRDVTVINDATIITITVNVSSRSLKRSPQIFQLTTELLSAYAISNSVITVAAPIVIITRKPYFWIIRNWVISIISECQFRSIRRIWGDFGPVSVYDIVGCAVVDVTSIIAVVVSQDEEETEHGKGFLRDIIVDEAWEVKLDKDLTKLQAAYNQLPSPITFKFIVNIIVSLVAELLILIALIVVVVIFVQLYSDVPGNIVVSGIRPALCTQIHYFAQRLLYNYSQIEVPIRVEFTHSTSPVWNDSSHVSANKNVIRQLLYGITEQFRKIHENVHFGTSDYTITKLRFIVSAIRMDIQEGLLKHSREILDSGLSLISLSKNVLIYSVIGCSVLQLILVVTNAIPWSLDVVRATTQSKKLLLLLPSQGRGSDRGDDSAEVEMQMLPSMRTGYPPIDNGRERIIEAAVALLDAIKTKESQSQINSLHSTLVQISYRQFTVEEREMIQREYTGSKDITMNDILQSGPGELGTNAQSIMNNVVGTIRRLGVQNEKENEFDKKNELDKIDIKILPPVEQSEQLKIETQLAQLQQQQSLINTQQQIGLDQNGQPILINSGTLNHDSSNNKSVKQIAGLTNDDLHERPKKGKNRMHHLISTSSDPKQHNFKTHAKEHIILRQRLTIIGDQLKVTGDVASKMIAKRNLIKLFDVHFTNADIVFGNTIPEEERTGFDEDEDEKDEQEEDDDQ